MIPGGGSNITASDAYIIDGTVTSGNKVATKAPVSGNNYGIWSFATAPSKTIKILKGATKRISKDVNGTLQLDMKAPAGYAVISPITTIIADTNETYAHKILGLNVDDLKKDPVEVMQDKPHIYQMNQFAAKVLQIVQGVKANITDIDIDVNVTSEGNITINKFTSTNIKINSLIPDALNFERNVTSKSTANLIAVAGTSAINVIESNGTVKDAMVEAAIAGGADKNVTYTEAITKLQAAYADINVTQTVTDANDSANAIDTAEDAIEAVTDKAKDVASSETVQNIVEKAGDTVEKVKDVAEDAAEKVVDKVKDVASSEPVQSALDKAEEMTEAVRDKAQGVVENIKDKFNEADDAVEAAAAEGADLVDSATDQAGDTASGITTQASDAVSSAAESLQEKAQDVVSEGTEAAGALVNTNEEEE